jgi:thiamine kinase-like enzyme
VTRDPKRGTADRLEAIVAVVPRLAGQVLETSEISSGLSNRTVKVTTPAGAYVVRMFPADPGLLPIDRGNEYANSVLAEASGVGARVVAYLPELAALVLEYIDGVPQTAQDLRGGDKPLRVARTLRRLHGGRPFAQDLDLFDVERLYLRIVDEHGFRLPDGYRDFLGRTEAIERAMTKCSNELRPCHNDVMPDNFIDVGGRELRLIDYEYAANNDPCFDLGGVWVESGMSLEQLEAVVAEYYGEPRPERVARARLWSIMWGYCFALWAAIKVAEGAAAEAWDLEEWARGRYERARSELASPELDELLAAIA